MVAFAKAQDYAVEVLVVDNASTDRTSDVVREIAAEHPIVSLSYQPIQGKGAAVRKGMLEGNGEYLFICDADLAMPIEEVSKLRPVGEHTFRMETQIGFAGNGELVVFEMDDRGKVQRVRFGENYVVPVEKW